MISKRLLVGLLASVLGLPIVVLVCQGLGRLLAAMNDEGGATLLRRLAQLGAAAWVLALVGTIVVLALARLTDVAAVDRDIEKELADLESEELEG
ncbi:MAG: hypothetical protein QM775_14030 [Pirellulales bacterium]